MNFFLRAERREKQGKAGPDGPPGRAGWFYHTPVFFCGDGGFIVDVLDQDLDETLFTFAAMGLWHAQKTGEEFPEFTYTLEITHDNCKKEFLSPILSWAAGTYLLENGAYKKEGPTQTYQGEMCFIWRSERIFKRWQDISLDESLAQVYTDISENLHGSRKGYSAPTSAYGGEFPELIETTAVEQLKAHLSWAGSNLHLIRRPA